LPGGVVARLFIPCVNQSVLTLISGDTDEIKY